MKWSEVTHAHHNDMATVTSPSGSQILYGRIDFPLQNNKAALDIDNAHEELYLVAGSFIVEIV